jgi:hypothetical protein
MMGGAEIRVDDGAARARAQRCRSDVRGREQRGSERGEQAGGGESFSLLERPSRALAEYSHRLCRRPLHTELPYCILETRPGPQHTHPPGPCASLTLVCNAIIVAI